MKLIFIFIFLQISIAYLDSPDNDLLINQYIKFCKLLDLELKRSEVIFNDTEFSIVQNTFIQRFSNDVQNKNEMKIRASFDLRTSEIIDAYVFSQKTNDISQCTQSAIDLKSDEFFAKYKDFFCKEPDYTNKIIEREDHSWRIYWERTSDGYVYDSYLGRNFIMLHLEENGNFISYSKSRYSGQCQDTHVLLTAKAAETIAEHYKDTTIQAISDVSNLPHTETILKIVSPNYFSDYYYTPFSQLAYEVCYEKTNVIGVGILKIWVSSETGEILGGRVTGWY